MRSEGEGVVVDEDGDVACIICGNVKSTVDVVRAEETDGDGRGVQVARDTTREIRPPQWMHNAPTCVHRCIWVCF